MMKFVLFFTVAVLAQCQSTLGLSTAKVNVQNTDSHAHPYGKPANILKFGNNSDIIIDEPLLDKIFLHPELKNRKVVVFSIIGAFRKGKSFFLDYCLRFLYANYKSVNFPTNPINDEKNWMGGENEPLQGFSWRSGTNRDTTGIIIWSDIFLHTIATTGEKIAIVVMDTQGLFDSETTTAGNSRIFALGTLISSLQALNLVGVIQEDQLQYLHFATEFAKFAARDSRGDEGKPFQNLLFLIRDWNNPDEFAFGTEGGENYLKTNVLKVKANQNSELKAVREFITSSFDDLSCFLLPHPGKKVATAKEYDGRWKLMDEDFKDELFKTIETVLAPENLVLKKINGKDLKAPELKDYMSSYFKLFQSKELPEAQTIYKLTVDKQMNTLIEKCLLFYMENIVKNKDLLEERNLHFFHEESKIRTLLMFRDEKKMGNREEEEKFKGELEAKLEKRYEEWKVKTEEHFKLMKAEVLKTEEAIKEKEKLEKELLEAERETQAKKAELEQQYRDSEIEKEKYKAQQEIIELRLKNQNDQLKMAEDAREADRVLREALEKHNEVLKSQPQPPIVVQSSSSPSLFGKIFDWIGI